MSSRNVVSQCRIALVAVLAVVGSAVARAGAPPAASWALNEGSGTTTADVSGSGNTGTLVSSPAWVTGHGGNALNFNNGTSYVDIASSTSLTNFGSTGMTLTAWIKPASMGGSGAGRIVEKMNEAWGIKLYDDNTVIFWVDRVTAELQRSSSANAISTNTWQHVTATWDGSLNAANVHIYINGVQLDGSGDTGSGAVVSDASQHVIIGNRATDLARNFDGAIDDVRVYNRVLTSTEIQAIVSDYTLPSTPSGLTATTASSTQINLSWSASSDNIAVTGYLVERCQGASCTSFTTIATPTGTTYSDTGRSASTSYSYRVRALDAAHNYSTNSSTASATTSGSGGGAPTNGLWLHHLYNETSGSTAADASGNGHTATLSGATWASGQTGNALSLDGVDDYALVTTSDLNQITSGVTVSAWVRLNAAASGWAEIASRQKSSAPADEHYGLAINGTTTWFFLYTSAGAEGCSGPNLSTGVWHHLVGTYDGASVKLYVNATLACTVAHSGTFGSDTTPLVISGNVNSIGGPVEELFPGRIDNLRIYSHGVTATEVALLASESNSSDTQAPTAPSSFSATAASSSQINLSWTASTDNVGVTGYVVERCQDSSCSSFAQIATPTGTTYSDTGLTASTSYSYRVKALDAASNASSFSSTASASTSSGGGGGDTQAPTVPTSVSATAASGSQINLSWTAASDNVAVTGYKVERCQGASCSGFAQIATPTGTSLADTGLAPSTVYRYQVRANDAAGNNSSYSSIVSATTSAGADTQAPTAPSGLTATPGTTTMSLSWTASTDNVGITMYLIERCQGAGCSAFTQVGTSTSASYYDTGLLAGIPYGYRVRARDAAGNLSAYSGGGVGLMAECD